jgi:hypothetical protein
MITRTNTSISTTTACVLIEVLVRVIMRDHAWWQQSHVLSFC